MKVLSESLIKQLSGEQAFTRGLKLFNQGRVGELELSNHEIKAQVDGKVSYNVTLHHTAQVFEGSCDCPASDRFDFCKHCVAASLAYYYQTQSNQEIAETSGNNRIAAYLNTLTKQDLTAALAELIQSNDELIDHWSLKAELASGQLPPAFVRKRITKSIRCK